MRVGEFLNHCLQIMMLKLRGHPPVLMKKDDGEKESHISTHLSKVCSISEVEVWVYCCLWPRKP